MKILIVDDSIQIRSLIKKMLKNSSRNFDLLECSDGEEALQINKTHKPELVLMDIMMQKLDGLTACKKITEDFPKTKVIIITQLSEDEYREEAFNSGAIEFLNKENLHQLPEIIKRIFNRGETDK